VDFYDVDGVLIRRWTPMWKGLCLDLWDGDRWVPYSDVDAVLRHGYRLTDASAIALLHEIRDRRRLAHLPDTQARLLLHTSGKRA
jgi:hypothetical protein